MLKKELRLIKRRDFLEVKNNTRVVWGNFFGIAYLKKNDPKIGFIVSKKTFARAVDRNRFRRVASQAIGEIGVPRGGWIVFIAKKEAFGLK